MYLSKIKLFKECITLQGRRKVEKIEGARSKTRLLDVTGFISNSVKIWGRAAAAPSAPPVPPALH